MLKLFSKKDRPFAHLKNINIEQRPIVTGFDFFDHFLAEVEKTNERDFIPYSEMGKLDDKALFDRFPFFGEILQAAPDVRAQTHIILRRIPSADRRMRSESTLNEFLHNALLILRDRLCEATLAPISEQLALEIIAEMNKDFVDPLLIDMLLQSFESGPSRALRKSVVGLVKQYSDPADLRQWNEIELLEKLEIFAGRDPAYNPLIAEAKQLFATKCAKRDAILKKCCPFLVVFFQETEDPRRYGGYLTLRAKNDQYIASISPYERGRILADMAELKKQNKEDPFWDSLIRWKRIMPGFHPNEIGSLFHRGADHGKQLNRKMILTSDQAYLLLEDGLGRFDTGRRFRTTLSSPLVRTLIKYMEPGARPDLVEPVAADPLLGRENKERLLLAMKGEEKPRETPDGPLRREIGERRAELQSILQTFPDLFFKLGNVFSIRSGTRDGNLFVIDHQAFPYFQEINRYVLAVAAAMQNGLDLGGEMTELRQFQALVEGNLARLGAGEGKPGRAIRALVQDEAVYRSNRRRFPGASASSSYAPESVEREEVIAAEKKMLEEICQWLQILSWHEDNFEFVRWRASVAPNDAASKPSAKWIEQVRDTFDPKTILNHLEDLKPISGAVPYLRLDLLDGPRTHFSHLTARFDKGVIWAAHLCDPDEAGPLLVDYIRRCFVSLPGVGIKAEKMGNAALWALQNMPDGKGVPYLAHILARNKYPKVRKKIDAMLNAAAVEAGINRATLDELTAPDHQMANGVKRLAVGDGTAILTSDGSKIHLSWEDGKGAPRKAPPQAIRDADPDGVRIAKALATEIEQDLATQSARLDGMYLKRRSWSYEEWRARYGDHGTLAMLARRLIWRAELPDGPVTILPTGTGCVDVEGRSVECTGARMHLWHPIDAHEAEIQAWRERLLELEIQQPFKQVWRETYQLTEAEVETGTYSNRFAGHIVRQHQMMTLAQLNGWKCTHRMWVDAPNDEPSHIQLSDFGLYAEFWTAGAGGLDEPPVLESGAYIYLTTDRLKFCRLDEDMPYGRGADIALDQVPAIVFSEIMRHCDLFTSVPSICLDAEWLDRGGNAEHPNQWRRDVADPYWQRGQIADLGTAAQMRRNVLAAILPRLKNSSAFELEERFLRVKGVRHDYSIHLGSGAVQLLPTARHICIVRAPTKVKQNIHLPFEGDQMLSLILSKALMLAQDDKISDPVILGQLR